MPGIKGNGVKAFFMPVGDESGCYVGPIHEGNPLEVLFCKRLPKNYSEMEDDGDLAKEIEDKHKHHEEHAHGAFEEHEGDNESSWFAEFTDLIFVAVIIKMADQTKWTYKCTYASFNHVTRGICEALLYHTGFFLCWLELTVALARFVELEGVGDDILWVTYLLGVIIMAVQITSGNDFRNKGKTSYYNQGGLTSYYDPAYLAKGIKKKKLVCYKDRDFYVAWIMENSGGYAIGFLMVLLSLVLMHALWGKYMPVARHYTNRRLKAFGLCSFLIFIAFLLHYDNYENQEDWRYWVTFILFATTMFIMYLVTGNSFRAWDHMPMNVEHLAERFGILVMILIGESILALILVPIKHDFEHYYFIVVAFLMMYFLKLIYFGSHTEEEGHALVCRQVPGALSWVYLHYPLSFFLLGCGVGFKLVVAGLDDYASMGKAIPKYYFTPVCLFTPLSVATMWAIRAAHKTFVFPMISAVRLFPLIMLGCGSQFGIIDVPGLLTWMLFWVLVCFAMDPILYNYEVDPEFRHIHEGEKSEEEHLAEHVNPKE